MSPQISTNETDTTIPYVPVTGQREAATERKKAFPYRFPRDPRLLGGNHRRREYAAPYSPAGPLSFRGPRCYRGNLLNCFFGFGQCDQSQFAAGSNKINDAGSGVGIN